jgi:hypothetical protein
MGKHQPSDVSGSSCEKFSGIFNFFTTNSFNSTVLKGPSDALEEEEEEEEEEDSGRGDCGSDGLRGLIVSCVTTRRLSERKGISPFMYRSYTRYRLGFPEVVLITAFLGSVKQISGH